MANLPHERLKACPPFTYVGLDVFGPWSVMTRRSRGGRAESKRWAIMFSCLSSRAVHIEIIESMDASSCINALRRLLALRGPAKQLHSDCGTNFIGACVELGMDKTVQKYLGEQGCSWDFKPPYASHMGGSWECMIGIARRILDSMLMQHKTRLTHEVLSTLMAEVTAIMNARPLLSVSTDPQQPFFHHHCFLHRNQEFHLLLEILQLRTFTRNNGDRCRLLRTSFGLGGAKNTYLPCNKDKSGLCHAETFKLGI